MNLNEIKRVLLVARKPSQEEFMQISKITGLGILLVGLLGFLLMTLGYLLVGGG